MDNNDIMQTKLENGRQYRSMQMEIRQDEKDTEQESFFVRGYATTFNEPYLLYSWEDAEVWEQVDANAFAECDMRDTIMQYDHRGRVFARVSNNTLSLTSDEHGLLIEADLGGTEIGRQLYEEIKGGYTSKMSFGFTVKEDEVTETHNKGEKTKYLRTIKSIDKLYDVSAVSLPANDYTEISARAFCDGVIAEAEAERLLKAEEERKSKAAELERRIKHSLLEVKINGN